MFGTNKIARRQHGTDGSLIVAEVFKTLQGEGPFAGTAAIFVRLAGCNLRCAFCDTAFEQGTLYTLRMLVEEVDRLSRTSEIRVSFVVITGGEPMLQNIAPFVRALRCEGMRVQIETAGTVVPDGWQNNEHAIAAEIVCSPKTPKVHHVIEALCTHWKYIVARDDIATISDGLPAFASYQRGAAKTMQRVRLYRPPSLSNGGTIWVQPRFDYIDNNLQRPDVTGNAANTRYAVSLALNYGYRLSLQQHKLLDLP